MFQFPTVYLFGTKFPVANGSYNQTNWFQIYRELEDVGCSPSQDSGQHQDHDKFFRLRDRESNLHLAVFFSNPRKTIILLMDEILHHLGCIMPCK